VTNACRRVEFGGVGVKVCGIVGGVDGIFGSEGSEREVLLLQIGMRAAVGPRREAGARGRPRQGESWRLE
jgi:hypothetical protein